MGILECQGFLEESECQDVMGISVSCRVLKSREARIMHLGFRCS